MNVEGDMLANAIPHAVKEEKSCGGKRRTGHGDAKIQEAATQEAAQKIWGIGRAANRKRGMRYKAKR